MAAVTEYEIPEMDARLRDFLHEIAKESGHDPEELAGKLISEQMWERTCPKVRRRGKVQAFCRKPKSRG